LRKKYKGRDKKQTEEWNKTHSLVVTNLKALGPISAIDLADTCNLHRQTIYKHLDQLKLEKKVRSTDRGWIWELEETITSPEMRDLPEIKLLQEACRNGSLLYGFNRPDFFKPKWKTLPSGLRESKKYDKQEIIAGRELGCIYVNISPKYGDDLFYGNIIWPILEEKRDAFLINSPYFLTESILQFLKSGKSSEIGIDIEYFTGAKDIKKLDHRKIEKMMRSVWDEISTIQVIYSTNINTLTKWIKTDSGKEALSIACNNDIVKKLAERIEKYWKIGDKFNKKLR